MSTDSFAPTDDLRAVLFDMDGTVVASEPLWASAMRRVAGDLGGEMTESALAATTGMSIPASVDILLRDIGSQVELRVDPATATESLLAATAEIFAEELMWQPGAEELIDAIREAGLKTALVTNSPRSVVDVAQALLGGHRFDATVCGDEVSHEKPDPAPYLAAMELLRESAAHCLAVEDSPSGTQAATAAGIAVLVVPSYTGVPEGPGRIFASSLLGATVQELHHIHREFRRSQQFHASLIER